MVRHYYIIKTADLRVQVAEELLLRDLQHRVQRQRAPLLPRGEPVGDAERPPEAVREVRERLERAQEDLEKHGERVNKRQRALIDTT